jgi:hypothetical protein
MDADAILSIFLTGCCNPFDNVQKWIRLIPALGLFVLVNQISKE